MLPQISKILSSGIFSGYFPYAPGTIGSLVALLIFLIPGFSQIYLLIPIILISFLIGIPLGNNFEKIYGKDPKQFTWDEFVGTWIAFLITPKSLVWIVVTFIIWRLFDILKPFPANKAEELNGGLGIMLDDVISGMYSLIIIYIFKVLFV
jgi:phosphatidylglycerophosphatase A